MSVFWPAQEQLPSLGDEYAEVAGSIPAEGTEAQVKKVVYADDPRYSTNGFLIVSYTDGSDIRFRMKKSTAEKLSKIMRAMLTPPLRKWEPPGGGVPRAREEDFEPRLRSGPMDPKEARKYLEGNFNVA